MSSARNRCTMMILAAAVCALATTAAAEPLVKANAGAAKKVLIVTGLDLHNWKATTPVLVEAIARDKRLEVSVSEDPRFLGSPHLKDYDVIVLHYMNWKDPGPGAEAQENFRKCVEGGTNLVLVHFACGAFQGWPEFVKVAGRIWNPKFRAHDPRGPFRVEIADPAHPITAAMAAFDADDELYTCLDGDTPIHVIATARSKVDKKIYPMAFTLSYGKARVFHCVLGHDVKALSMPGVATMFRRGTAWATGIEPAKP